MTSPWDRILALTYGASEAFIAAPYIKEASLQRLLEHLPQLERLICVTRWQAKDIAAGVSDTAVRSQVQSFGGAFRLHPSLHAKYYRFDDRVLVGSANLTDAGLGVGRIHNLEILTKPEDGFDSNAFERKLMAGSLEIDESEAAAWEAIAVVEPKARVGPDSALQDWYPATRDPADLWQFYFGHRELLSFETQQHTNADLMVLGLPARLDPQGFVNWVSVSLLSSSFVADVRKIGKEEEPQAFLQLGDYWGLEPGAARYAAETVRAWVAYFLSS